jgi:hypothetical protein
MLMHPTEDRSHDCGEGWMEEHGYAPLPPSSDDEWRQFMIESRSHVSELCGYTPAQILAVGNCLTVLIAAWDKSRAPSDARAPEGGDLAEALAELQGVLDTIREFESPCTDVTLSESHARAIFAALSAPAAPPELSRVETLEAERCTLTTPEPDSP